MLLQMTVGTSSSRTLAQTVDSAAVASRLRKHPCLMLFVQVHVGPSVPATLLNLLWCEMKCSIGFQIRWSRPIQLKIWNVTSQQMLSKYFSESIAAVSIPSSFPCFAMASIFNSHGQTAFCTLEPGSSRAQF